MEQKQFLMYNELETMKQIVREHDEESCDGECFIETFGVLGIKKLINEVEFYKEVCRVLEKLIELESKSKK